MLAGEHVLLIGPLGTAKSALVRCIAQLFGGSYFERLLTRFSTPEELFGPISIQALAQDHFVRHTAGKLPEAEFAFIDEIFKSNSAVLNALLSNHQRAGVHNDGAPVAYPLVSLFAASSSYWTCLHQTVRARGKKAKVIETCIPSRLDITIYAGSRRCSSSADFRDGSDLLDRLDPDCILLDTRPGSYLLRK